MAQGHLLTPSPLEDLEPSENQATAVGTSIQRLFAQKRPHLQWIETTGVGSWYRLHYTSGAQRSEHYLQSHVKSRMPVGRTPTDVKWFLHFTEQDYLHYLIVNPKTNLCSSLFLSLFIGFIPLQILKTTAAFKPNIALKPKIYQNWWMCYKLV